MSQERTSGPRRGRLSVSFSRGCLNGAQYLIDPPAHCKPLPLARKQLNHPVTEDDATWYICLEGPTGGETQLFLNRDEVAQYNADPDLFAAKSLGFATVDEYREWVQSNGYALCSERTRSGKLCRNLIGGGSLNPAKWREHHRSAACFIHGGGRS